LERGFYGFSAGTRQKISESFAADNERRNHLRYDRSKQTQQQQQQSRKEAKLPNGRNKQKQIMKQNIVRTRKLAKKNKSQRKFKASRNENFTLQSNLKNTKFSHQRNEFSPPSSHLTVLERHLLSLSGKKITLSL